MARHDLSTATVGTLLDDPDVMDIIRRHYPAVAGQEGRLGQVRDLPVGQALRMASGYVGADRVATIRSEIEAL